MTMASQTKMYVILRQAANVLMQVQARWDVFYDFHDWLFATYPTVFQNSATTVTKINAFAILTEIKGTDESLKPLMLTSHMDAVPVEQRTLDRWTYPPFEGKYDGEYIHGRGAGDCKSSVDMSITISGADPCL